MSHLLTLFDLTSDDIEHIFALAGDLKAQLEAGRREPILPGRVLALLFDKPSLRTRVSFESGMAHLGGSSLYLGKDVGWGHRESLEDFARVLAQYVDGVVCRTFEHERLEELARHCDKPVINGLTDASHPCQALADLFTLRELRGELRGRTLAYVGDGNNVARSLAVGCAKLGMRLTLATPEGYGLPAEFLEKVRALGDDVDILPTGDAAEAVADAVAVYTDVWVSMGQEKESEQRRRDLTPYQVNQALMKQAPADAVFLHCLPAHRGEEVTDEVIDGPQSAVIQQAGNRMHAQKGVLAWLLGGED